MDHRRTTDTKRPVRGGRTPGGMWALDDLVGENPPTCRAAGETGALLERESRQGDFPASSSEMRRGGETRTGKTVLARLVHRTSTRSKRLRPEQLNGRFQEDAAPDTDDERRDPSTLRSCASQQNRPSPLRSGADEAVTTTVLGKGPGLVPAAGAGVPAGVAPATPPTISDADLPGDNSGRGERI